MSQEQMLAWLRSLPGSMLVWSKWDIAMSEAVRAVIKNLGEADKVIAELMKASITLMGEVCRGQAADWGIVNNAMVAGERYLQRGGEVNIKKIIRP